MKVVYLKPKSSYKTVLYSDTIFGLLCWGIKTVFSEKDLLELLDKFSNNHPPFLISSAFLYKEDADGKIHFLPKPILKPPSLSKYTIENLSKIKEFKKVKLVNSKIFQKFIEGELTNQEFFEKELWRESKMTLQTEQIQHNVIDRLSGITGEGGLFYTEEYFHKNSGLYFLMKVDKEAEKYILGSLAFLEHFGFGGDHSTGKGRFEVSIDECKFLREVDNPTHFITLSLYYPKKEEIVEYKNKPDDVWYHLQVRKGKIGGAFLHPEDFWKETVIMFAEGSTFPKININPIGQNPVVKKYPFEVQNYGYAFPIGMRKKEV